MDQITGLQEMRFLAQGTSDATRLADLAREMGSLEPEKDPDIATWEAVLLDLRVRLSGRRVSAELTCPDCEEGNALIFSVDDLPQSATPVHDKVDGIKLRPLRLSDLIAIEANPDNRLRDTLMRASQQPAEWADQVLANQDELPDVLDALERALVGLDIQLSSQCSACNVPIISPFDVQAYVLNELQASARSLLDQVHRIASAYHWSEHDILSLPRSRRLAYLDRIDRDALNIEVGHVRY